MAPTKVTSTKSTPQGVTLGPTQTNAWRARAENPNPKPGPTPTPGPTTGTNPKQPQTGQPNPIGQFIDTVKRVGFQGISDVLKAGKGQHAAGLAQVGIDLLTNPAHLISSVPNVVGNLAGHLTGNLSDVVKTYEKNGWYMPPEIKSGFAQDAAKLKTVAKWAGPVASALSLPFDVPSAIQQTIQDRQQYGKAQTTNWAGTPISYAGTTHSAAAQAQVVADAVGLIPHPVAQIASAIMSIPNTITSLLPNEIIYNDGSVGAPGSDFTAPMTLFTT